LLILQQNIDAWEVVAANGSIINIDAKKQPDLARAMRGGGNQFGGVLKQTLDQQC